MDAGAILDVNRWDGSDFIGGTMSGIVTWRALDFLLRIHAAPLKAEPMRADVRGISEEQRDWLKRAERPVRSIN